MVYKDIYKLRLPPKSRSHLVFYIIQMEPALLDIPLIDKEDRRNRKARLTTERAEAAAIRNDAFNPEVFE